MVLGLKNDRLIAPGSKYLFEYLTNLDKLTYISADCFIYWSFAG